MQTWIVIGDGDEGVGCILSIRFRFWKRQDHSLNCFHEINLYLIILALLAFLGS
jgi:hypothetical protein